MVNSVFGFVIERKNHYISSEKCFGFMCLGVHLNIFPDVFKLSCIDQNLIDTPSPICLSSMKYDTDINVLWYMIYELWKKVVTGKTTSVFKTFQKVVFTELDVHKFPGSFRKMAPEVFSKRNNSFCFFRWFRGHVFRRGVEVVLKEIPIFRFCFSLVSSGRSWIGWGVFGSRNRK